VKTPGRMPAAATGRFAEHALEKRTLGGPRGNLPARHQRAPGHPPHPCQDGFQRVFFRGIQFQRAGVPAQQGIGCGHNDFRGLRWVVAELNPWARLEKACSIWWSRASARWRAARSRLSRKARRTAGARRAHLVLEDIIRGTVFEASTASSSPNVPETNMNGVSGDSCKVRARASKPSKACNVRSARIRSKGWLPQRLEEVGTAVDPHQFDFKTVLHQPALDEFGSSSLSSREAPAGGWGSDGCCSRGVARGPGPVVSWFGNAYARGYQGFRRIQGRTPFSDASQKFPGSLTPPCRMRKEVRPTPA